MQKRTMYEKSIEDLLRKVVFDLKQTLVAIQLSFNILISDFYQISFKDVRFRYSVTFPSETQTRQYQCELYCNIE